MSVQSRLQGAFRAGFPVPALAVPVVPHSRSNWLRGLSYAQRRSIAVPASGTWPARSIPLQNPGTGFSTLAGAMHHGARGPWNENFLAPADIHVALAEAQRVAGYPAPSGPALPARYLGQP